MNIDSLKEILNIFKYGIIVLNRQTECYVYANSAGLKWLGVDCLDDIKDKKFENSFNCKNKNIKNRDIENKDILIAYYRELWKTGGRAQYDYINQFGEIQKGNVVIIPLPHPHEDYIIAVEEKSHKQTELEENNLVMKYMLNTCQTGIACADEKGILVYVNYELLYIYKYKNIYDMVGTHVGVFFYEHQTANKVIETLNKDEVYYGEMIIKCEDGSVKPILLRAFQIITPNNKKYMYGSVIDISQQKEAEKEHRRLLKERFLKLTETDKKVLWLIYVGIIDKDEITKIMGWADKRTVYFYFKEIEERLFIKPNTIIEFVNKNKFLFEDKQFKDIVI